MVNMTAGENLLVMVLSNGIVNFPASSYLSLLYWERSLNFSMLMSARLAPKSFELMF